MFVDFNPVVLAATEAREHGSELNRRCGVVENHHVSMVHPRMKIGDAADDKPGNSTLKLSDQRIVWPGTEQAAVLRDQDRLPGAFFAATQHGLKLAQIRPFNKQYEDVFTRVHKTFLQQKFAPRAIVSRQLGP